MYTSQTFEADIMDRMVGTICFRYSFVNYKIESEKGLCG